MWNLVKNEYGYQNEQYIQKFVDYEIKLNDSYNYHYSSSYSAIDVKIKNCQLLFDLTLRDTNNLVFLINELSGVYFCNYSFIIYLCCVVVKKMSIEEVNIEMIKSRKYKLEVIYEDYEINRIITDIEHNLNGTSNLKDVEKSLTAKGY